MRSNVTIGLIGDRDESVLAHQAIPLALQQGAHGSGIGFLGMGDKLFAVPWYALKLDTVNKRFVLNVDKDRLESAPGFDKDNWPNMSDQAWAQNIHSYYGTKPYVNDLPM